MTPNKAPQKEIFTDIAVLAKLGNGKIHQILLNEDGLALIVNVIRSLSKPIKLNETELKNIEF